MPFNYKLSKPVILLTVVVILAFITLLTFLLYPRSEEVRQSKIEESIVTNVPGPGSSYQVITPEIEQKISRDEKVGQLINKLPFQTLNGSLEYDFSSNGFVFWYKKDARDKAEQELSEFLAENGIENKDWLTNLVIQSE